MAKYELVVQRRTRDDTKLIAESFVTTIDTEEHKAFRNVRNCRNMAKRYETYWNKSEMLKLASERYRVTRVTPLEEGSRKITYDFYQKKEFSNPQRLNARHKLNL